MQSYCLHTHRAEREILQHCSRKARGDPFSNLRGSLLFLKMHSGNLRPQKPTSPKPRLHLKWTNECEKRPEAAFSSDALQRVYCYAILVHCTTTSMYHSCPVLPHSHMALTWPPLRASLFYYYYYIDITTSTVLEDEDGKNYCAVPFVKYRSEIGFFS